MPILTALSSSTPCSFCQQSEPQHTSDNFTAFSPDGHRLAVVKAFGNEVTIYDATPLPEKP